MKCITKNAKSIWKTTRTPETWVQTEYGLDGPKKMVTQRRLTWQSKCCATVTKISRPSCPPSGGVEGGKTIDPRGLKDEKPQCATAKHSGPSLPLLGRQTEGLLSLWLKGSGRKEPQRYCSLVAPPCIKEGITKRHALRKNSGPFAKKKKKN